MLGFYNFSSRLSGSLRLLVQFGVSAWQVIPCAFVITAASAHVIIINLRPSAFLLSCCQSFASSVSVSKKLPPPFFSLPWMNNLKFQLSTVSSSCIHLIFLLSQPIDPISPALTYESVQRQFVSS